jgi:hypothetical protein
MAYKTRSAVSWYQARGFYPLNVIEPGGLRAYSAAAVAIKKGDALHVSSAPYVTNAVYAFANTFAGIAAADFDNSTAYSAPRLPGYGTGSADDTAADNLVLVIPWTLHVQ